jgi:hypothetical protein
MLEAALLYHKQGFSIIPIGRNKRPVIASWKKYQDEQATLTEIVAWFSMPNVNIGLVTGKVSGVVVADFDIKHGRKSSEFPIAPTACSKTGGGGEHLFYKYPGYHVPSTNGVLFGNGIDIKADGGYVVLPPSLHASGNEYEWLIPLEKDVLADIPQWLEKKLEEHPVVSKQVNWETLAETDVPEGKRHDTLVKFAGKLLHDLSPALWEKAGWPALVSWNHRYAKPPLRPNELRAIWDGLSKKELANRENKKSDGPSAATKVLTLLQEDPRVELFHNQHEEPYIKLPVKDHLEIWSCTGKKLEKYISMKFWELFKEPAATETVKKVLSVLRAKASFEGKRYQMHNRVAWHDGSLWYDLSDEHSKAVRIDKNGWALTSPPILFQEYAHQKPQVLPSSAGDVRELLKFVNITNKQHELLLMVFLVSSFIPDIPHVIPIVYGPQGSAKSTLLRLLRLVCDPSGLDIISLPRFQDMPQTLAHHWFLTFDNVSFISEEMSDLFCKVVTGSGFTKRQLYTDDEDIIYSFKRVIGLNGINLVALRPDLLERSILIELERIPDERRKEEKEIMSQFDNALPNILAGVFDTLSKAIAIQPSVRLAKLPRMADFAVWGYAIAEAMGYGGQAFLDAYTANIATQNEEVLTQDPVGAALVVLMKDTSFWEGTMTELHKKMNEIAWSQLDISVEKDPSWPKTANHLSRRINMLEIVLRSHNLYLTKSNQEEQRIISIEKRQDSNATDAKNDESD